jgi:hypothetical protein
MSAVLAFAALGCGAVVEEGTNAPRDSAAAEFPGTVRIPITDVGTSHWDSPLLSEKPPEIVATTYRVVGDIEVSAVHVRLVEGAGGYFVRVSYVVDSARGPGAIEILDAEASESNE